MSASLPTIPFVPSKYTELKLPLIILLLAHDIPQLSVKYIPFPEEDAAIPHPVVLFKDIELKLPVFILVCVQVLPEVPVT